MNDKLKMKLKNLPSSPGVYFHKSKTGEIIYIGKAAVLKNRVKSYFHPSTSLRAAEPKTAALIAEIFDTTWIETDSEIDALFLESEMVKRYMPRFNILLRDDKSQLFVRINIKDEVPFVSTTRQPADDGADYYGPYFNGWAVKKALRLLRRVFPHYTKAYNSKPDFDFHLRLSPGVETGKISPHQYKKNLRQLIRYFKGERKKIIVELEKDMKQASKQQRFEDAAALRNKLRSLAELQRQILFGRDEFLDISKDQALVGLQTLLGLKKVPRRIEGYDISHMSGRDNAASMVVATNGMADKAQYRKFKLRLPGNDDFAHMNEALSRRFSGRHASWPQPDLILIDGGKGQLHAALKALQEKNVNIPAIGLAKRIEEIIIPRKPLLKSSEEIAKNSQFARNEKSGNIRQYRTVLLPPTSSVLKLLQRIRDESHRFAVSYHTTLKRSGQTTSVLESVPGIGQKTRTKLLRKFGSLRGISQADQEQLVGVIGAKKASLLRQAIGRSMLQ